MRSCARITRFAASSDEETTKSVTDFPVRLAARLMASRVSGVTRASIRPGFRDFKAADLFL